MLTSDKVIKHTYNTLHSYKLTVKTGSYIYLFTVDIFLDRELAADTKHSQKNVYLLISFNFFTDHSHIDCNIATYSPI